jgi:uncharacterized integral membrane protein
MKLLFWAIAAPLVVIAASFAVSNRQTVEVGIWPLPFTWDAPVFMIVLGSLGVGVVLGGAVAGLGAIGARFRARSASRRVASLERELSAQKLSATEHEPQERLDQSGLSLPVPGPVPGAPVGGSPVSGSRSRV